MVIRSAARAFAPVLAAVLLAACASGPQIVQSPSAQPAAFVGAVPAAQGQAIDDDADAFWDSIGETPVDFAFEEPIR